ncbi:MAG: 23S rRNA (uracil(1939)-C(5))-methyltransferase RlmD [Lachnospiraceae bacterium]|nr:23S rRNA (uracil(1939)-C(5))-methyltransferase RlmD [Lachnospiraceae bacterium]
MKKNDIATVVIEDMTTEGEGIGHADGFTLFVKDTVIGDTARVKVMKAKKTYGYARLVELISASPDRREAACPVARACGGCQLQTLSYEKQLEFKRNKVVGHLQRIGGFGPEVTGPVAPTIGMEEPYRYRNKALIPFGMKDGRIIAGFYAGHTHSIIEQSDCLLTPPEYEQILLVLLNWAEKYRISVYMEETGTGALRHVLIRKGFSTGEIMICLVIGTKNLPQAAREALREQLLELKPRLNIAQISLNINLKNTNVVMGTDGIIDLYGPGYITDRIGEVSYRISPLSFYQVNPVQTEKLYGCALKFAGLTGSETVWDLYCGIGTISLFLAKAAEKVYGVEIVPEAVRDAVVNAEDNNITNASFFTGRAEEIMPELYNREPETYRADVVVVDPPRKGCGPELLETILKMGPKRIVYVSCDSATLARDLKLLCTDSPYRVSAVQPVDMFPQSVHVETVVLLERCLR